MDINAGMHVYTNVYVVQVTSVAFRRAIFTFCSGSAAQSSLFNDHFNRMY